MIYLDNAATTPLLPSVKEFLCESLEIFGNPSSPHKLGAEAREKLEEARNRLADLLGVRPENIVFNSGATEGNNTVLRGVLGRRGNVVISAIEHKSVSACAKYLSKKGIEIREVRVNSEGLVDLDHLGDLIDGDTLLVSIMHVSNEFGTIQPVGEISKICKEKGVPFHTDAVQALGKVDLNLEEVDYATFSAHKFHAPKGVGFLYVKGELEPLILGGGQERGLRSGTENLHGILAMVKALEEIHSSFEENVRRLEGLRNSFEELVEERLPGVRIVGKKAPRSPSISTLILPQKSGWEVVSRLSEEGVFCSAGSACTSGETVPNEHLMKMGYSFEEATRMTRFSFGLMNREEEIEEAVEKLVKATLS